MAQKSFVTNMPDKAGTFLRASKIIARHNGNIIRVSYNKAVDLHMLFIDVEADADKLRRIEEDLSEVGYINKKITETRVIEVSVRIPDRPGAVLPVLEILNKFDINISYMNSFAGKEPYQDFKFGLLIEDPKIIKTLLDCISTVYPIDIIECESSEENLDNTVFYIRLANEMKNLFDLTEEKMMEFISESNRIHQMLQSEGEDAGKVFDYVRRSAHFVSDCRGSNYKTNTQKLSLSDSVTLYNIQPLCGSNTYLLSTPEKIYVIDTGYSIFADEWLSTVKALIPDWESCKKEIYITHADIDHCGLIYRFGKGEVFVNQKSADNFRRQRDGLPDYREQKAIHLGYSKISRIISGYVIPDTDKMKIIDSDTPEEHDSFVSIGNMDVGDLNFEILEGSGGHLDGEMVYICRKAGVVFTGDILVNISGFSKERAEFNSLAPYLMKSVNVNSRKATEMRKQLIYMIQDISENNKKPCIICGGHGPLSILSDGKMISIDI